MRPLITVTRGDTGDLYAKCPVCRSHSIRRGTVPEVIKAMEEHGREFRHRWTKIRWR